MSDHNRFAKFSYNRVRVVEKRVNDMEAEAFRLIMVRVTF